MVHFRLPIVDRMVHRHRERRALRRQQKDLRPTEPAITRERHHHRQQRRSRRSSRRLAGPLLFSSFVKDTQAQETPKPQFGFSFSGGGWLMVYMYGVAKALREYGLHHDARFIGTSAGSLAIVGIAADNDFDAMVETIVTKYVPRVHWSLWGPFRMREYLIDAVTRHTDASRVDSINACCTIVYTSLSSWVARKKSQFRDFEHLLTTLVASCCATPLVGLPFWHEGELVMDGGIMENQPVFPDLKMDQKRTRGDNCSEKPREFKVVTVSPNIYSGADIQPSRYVPAWWSMYPPSQENMRWAYDLGYEDGLNWIVREKAVPCVAQIEIPTKASAFNAGWKTAFGQTVGYHWIDSQVSAAMAVAESLKRMYRFLWTVIVPILSLPLMVAEPFALLWTILATSSLVGLYLQDHHVTLEFVLVAVSHGSIVAMKIRSAWSQEVRSSIGAVVRCRDRQEGPREVRAVDARDP